MKIQTDYFGEVEYSEEDLVTIPDGIFGFTDLKRYLPLCLDDENDLMLLFQSTERPEVAFVVINPVFLRQDYSPLLTPEELSFLGVSESGELSYYVICVLRDNYLENTVNLKCPLAINPQTRIGMQVIMENSPYGFRHKLSSFPCIAEPEYVSDRSDEEDADSQT